MSERNPYCGTFRTESKCKNARWKSPEARGGCVWAAPRIRKRGEAPALRKFDPYCRPASGFVLNRRLQNDQNGRSGKYRNGPKNGKESKNNNDYDYDNDNDYDNENDNAYSNEVKRKPRVLSKKGKTQRKAKSKKAQKPRSQQISPDEYEMYLNRMSMNLYGDRPCEELYDSSEDIEECKEYRELTQDLSDEDYAASIAAFERKFGPPVLHQRKYDNNDDDEDENEDETETIPYRKTGNVRRQVKALEQRGKLIPVQGEYYY